MLVGGLLLGFTLRGAIDRPIINRLTASVDRATQQLKKDTKAMDNYSDDMGRAIALLEACRQRLK